MASVLLASVWVIGAVFVTAGLLKFADRRQFISEVVDYRVAPRSMATATLFNPNVDVQCELPVPAGFQVEDRLNPSLAYPFELGGITNIDLPPGEASPESGFPRVDLIPEHGVLLWIVAYDTTWESNSARRPKTNGAQLTGVPGLMSRASRASRWDNVRWDQTVVDLGPTKRCHLFTFAGPDAEAAESRIDGVAPAIHFRG